MNLGQLDPTEYHSWPLDASTGGWGTSELRWIRLNIAPLLSTRWHYQGEVRDTSELRSTGSNWVPLLATRCLYQGVGVHLTRGQPDLKADQMSYWPEVVLCLATRCLYWGLGMGYQGDGQGHWGVGATSEKIKTVYCKVLLKTQDILLNTEDKTTWAQVNWTQLCTTLGH